MRVSALAVPFIVQVFYGTLAMLAIGVILFTVLSLSAGAAVLLFLAYLGFRFGARRECCPRWLGGLGNILTRALI